MQNKHSLSLQNHLSLGSSFSVLRPFHKLASISLYSKDGLELQILLLTPPPKLWGFRLMPSSWDVALSLTAVWGSRSHLGHRREAASLAGGRGSRGQVRPLGRKGAWGPGSGVPWTRDRICR